MKTLIMLGSKPDVALKLAHARRPERIVVLTTTEYEAEWTEAKVVLDGDLACAGGTEVRVIAEGAHDPIAWQRAVHDEIVGQRRAGHDVDVDVTGGTKPMGLGAYVAAEVSGAPTTYLASTWKEDRREESSTVIELPSIRKKLGLDFQAAADEAFKLAHFDAAHVLYRRISSPLADVASAYQAWLDGHFATASDLFPKVAGPPPRRWRVIADQLRRSNPDVAHALGADDFGEWLRDRRFALRLLRDKGHADAAVAQAAWRIIEEVARAALRIAIKDGAPVVIGTTPLRPVDVTTASSRKFTIGPLLGLLCGHEGTHNNERLRVIHDTPLLSTLRAPMRELRSGLTLRNGLSHGFADAKETRAWVAEHVREGGSVEKLSKVMLEALPGGEARTERLPDPNTLRERLVVATAR